MNKLLNIYEGFFGNIRADLRSEFVFKFIDNMTNKYSDQLLSIIRDKVDEVNKDQIAMILNEKDAALRGIIDTEKAD